MKKRNGFVSNSSSSSFIVLKKDENMSFEDLKVKSLEALNGYCDYGDDPYPVDQAEEYANNNQYIIFMESIERGVEEGVERLISNLLKKLGISTDNISFKWGE